MSELLKVTISPNREIRLSRSLAVRRKRGVDWDGTEGSYLSDAASPAPISTEGSAATDSLLDISAEFQRDGQTSRPGWGELPAPRQFGTNQKRLMLRAGAVCDRAFGTNQVVLTGTLPGNTNEANYALACWSGYALNRLQQWVRRIVDTSWTFGVWEYQERGALHLHVCVCFYSQDQADRLISGFRGQWVKILGDISRRSGIDLFDSGRGFSWEPDSECIQADAQAIQKSCAAYFAKYATKGYDDKVKDQMRLNALFRFNPSRWIVVSRAISRAIKEQTFAFEIEGPRGRIERDFEDWLHELESNCVKHFAYNHKVIAGKTHVFYLSDEQFSEMSEYVKKEFSYQHETATCEESPSPSPGVRTLSRPVQAALPQRKNKLQVSNGRRLLVWPAHPFRRGRILEALALRVPSVQLTIRF